MRGSNITIKIQKKSQTKQKENDHTRRSICMEYEHHDPVLIKCRNNTCFVGDSTSDSEEEDDDVGEGIESSLPASPNNSTNTALGLEVDNLRP